MIKPHGGRLVNRVLSGKKAAAFLKDNRIPALILDHDTLLDLENIATGAYSPLQGFMTKEELKSVVYRKRLLNDLVWTVPIILSVNDLDKKITPKSLVILRNLKGDAIGLLKVVDIYTVDKTRIAKNIYGTNDSRHPGVNKFYNSGNIFIGGEIWLIEKNKFDFCDFNLSPLEARKIIQDRRWKSVVGFQTRNIPHRAHEFLQKIGLSMADGIMIHPIIGWKKKGDFSPEMIIKTYKILINNYYPKDKVLFSGLATAMRYAGPKEAVFHALIRKNFGCTHFIVGRDHAGVGGFYDKYAAHRIFDTLPDLGIVPMLLNGPYYCRKCLGVVSEKICPHPDRDNIEISGTLIRQMIEKRKLIPEEFLRREIAEFILKYSHKCFL